MMQSNGNPLTHCRWRCKMQRVQPLSWVEQLQIKLYTHLLYNPDTPILGIYLRERKNRHPIPNFLQFNLGVHISPLARLSLCSTGATKPILVFGCIFEQPLQLSSLAPLVPLIYGFLSRQSQSTCILESSLHPAASFSLTTCSFLPGIFFFV